MTTNPQNYSEFWDFYVSEHSLPLTRVLHFVGTSLGIALAGRSLHKRREAEQKRKPGPPDHSRSSPDCVFRHDNDFDHRYPALSIAF